MIKITRLASIIFALICVTAASAQENSISLHGRINTPDGFKRIDIGDTSFGAWLRKLPVRPGRPEIRLFDGRPAPNQNDHYAVLDIDIGSEDLQQCADIVIRFRAEYLFDAGCEDDIRFCFTNGDTASWNKWRRGFRPQIKGSRVSWRLTAESDSSHENFARYLDTVFMYAGSYSLSKELYDVADPSRIEIGDVFIRGGTPGHAMIVVDVAENNDGKRIFLLVQGYMPAQDIQIVKSEESISPWFTAQESGTLKVPGTQKQYMVLNDSGPITTGTNWPFNYTHLKRFRRSDCD